MKLRVWDTRISLQDVAGTPGAPPKQKLQDGNLNVLGGTKPTGSVRPGRPKTSQAIERISIHDIMSIRIAPLLIQIDQCSYKLPKPFGHPWANPVPNVDPNPGFPRIPLVASQLPACHWVKQIAQYPLSTLKYLVHLLRRFTCGQMRQNGLIPIGVPSDSWPIGSIGSMVLLYMVIWIPSIYPQC